MDFFTSMATEKAVDHIVSKVSGYGRNLKGQHDDAVLGDSIRQELLERYGNEPFYNDLDSYLTSRNTIDLLITDLRNPPPQQGTWREKFIADNFTQFSEGAPSCRACPAPIKEAFSRIFDYAYSAVLDIKPHSIPGQLQSESRVQHAEIIGYAQDIQSGLIAIRDSMSNLQNASASGLAAGARESGGASARGGKSVPGLFMINPESIAAYKTAIDSLPVQAYRRISTNIKNILYAVCSGMTIECMLEDRDETLVSFLQKKVTEGSQAILLLGNGGIGKSTTLVQTAVQLCISGNRLCQNIYLFQLGSKYDAQIIDQVLERIAGKPEQKHILFIDNPYDNVEGAGELLDNIQYETNVQVVMSERLNRFESIAEDILPDLYFASAQIIVPLLKEEQVHIKKVDGQRISRLRISHKWKQDVVLHMFRSIPNVDMPKIESIVKGQNPMSVIEWYLRTCIVYNKCVDTEEALATHCKIKLDWDEWRELFHTPHPQFSEDEAKELRELFRVVAALDVFKIKASTKLLAQKSNISELRLDGILRSTLNTASNEPAIYENDSEYPYVALKHDMISTLFFEVEEENPQLILEHIVNSLVADEEAVVRFEKQVFKRRYIQHGNKAPFHINTPKLYQLFAQNPSYYEILRERRRAYSFDVAGVWQQAAKENEAAVSDIWDSVLTRYMSEEPRIKAKVFMCCLDDCQRRSIPFPKTLLTEKSAVIDLRAAAAQGDLPGIAAAWKTRFSQLYTYGITGKELMIEWRKAIFDYLLYEFDMPDEFFSIFDHADYQVVDAAYATLESYVKRNRLNKRRYYELGIQLYAAIADRQREDVSSRMRLARCYVQNKELRRAESIYCELLELYPDHVKANSALGSVCAQRLKDEWKELKANDAEKKRLMETYKSSLERAIELAEKEEDKCVCYSVMGRFLYRTMRRYQESYNAFQTALGYHETVSIHSQLGMLCSNYNKNNTCFSIDEAKYHFERAISLLKSTDLGLLPVYIPYANMYYCLGEYDKAIDLYQKAEQLGEQKATKMLKKIQDERAELAELSACPRKTMTTLKMTYDRTCEDTAAFDNEHQMNEIFSLLLNSMADEKKTPYDIKQAIGILRNFRRSNSRYKFGIIAKRVTQQVEAAAISHDVYKSNAEQNFRTQCFFIGRDL